MKRLTETVFAMVAGYFIGRWDATAEYIIDAADTMTRDLVERMRPHECVYRSEYEFMRESQRMFTIVLGIVLVATIVGVWLL